MADAMLANGSFDFSLKPSRIVVCYMDGLCQLRIVVRHQFCSCVTVDIDLMAFVIGLGLFI